MRLRLGLVVGFAAGAYAATALQKRNQQRGQTAGADDRTTSPRVAGTEASRVGIWPTGQPAWRTVGQVMSDAAKGKAKDAVNAGVERVRDRVAGRQPPRH